MGLLQVGIGAASSVLADQWREYFICPALDENTLVTKGAPRKGKGIFNKGSDNLISNGSIIAVNEGQCMMIVQNGAIVEVCAQAGEFVWDSSTEPSIFYGGLKEGIVNSFNTWKKRFTLGGDTGTDQRVYFFNTKEIIGNKYGTVNPIPYRVVDTNIRLDMDMAIRCHGEYVYHMSDPILFYKKVCGNIEDDYQRSRIDSQLKSELLTALQPAFASISAKGIRYSQLPAYTKELTAAMDVELDKTWGQNYGIEIVTIGVSSATLSEEDQMMLKRMQQAAVYSNPAMAGGAVAAAQAQAMVDAANNTNGAMMGFAGMGMAMNNGGMNSAALFSQAAQQPAPAPAPAAAPAPAPAKMQAGGWTCACGNTNSGKFCSNCGSPMPAQDWTCTCGNTNSGKFCSNCGSPRP